MIHANSLNYSLYRIHVHNNSVIITYNRHNNIFYDVIKKKYIFKTLGNRVGTIKKFCVFLFNYNTLNTYTVILN